MIRWRRHRSVSSETRRPAIREIPGRVTASATARQTDNRSDVPRPQTPARPASRPRDSQFLSRGAESGSDGADRDLVCVTVRHHYGPCRARLGGPRPRRRPIHRRLTTAARQYLSAINVSCRAVVARSFDKDRQRRRRPAGPASRIYIRLRSAAGQYTVESRGASRALSSIIDGAARGRYTSTLTLGHNRRAPPAACHVGPLTQRCFEGPPFSVKVGALGTPSRPARRPHTDQLAAQLKVWDTAADPISQRRQLSPSNIEKALKASTLLRT